MRTIKTQATVECSYRGFAEKAMLPMMKRRSANTLMRCVLLGRDSDLLLIPSRY